MPTHQNLKQPRVIAIGDIHGCATALSALINAIKPDTSDTIVSLGDVIDYGPDSKEVVCQLLALQSQTNLVYVRGNHEVMLLDVVDRQASLVNWAPHGGDATLFSYDVDLPREIPREHLDLMRRSRLFWETDTHLFVHAGYNPEKPLDRTPARVLCWEFLDENRARPHYSRKTAIVGHKPQTTGEILDLGFLCCIDTDCSRGNWLTGLDVTTGHYWQANQSGEVRERDRQNPTKT
ncbi:MAG: metallophosphoesterase family protein [bacterium]